MLIDITRIERSKVESVSKYERHSENVLQLIRKEGLEEETNYVAYGETFNLSTSDELVSIRFKFKPRGYKKQVAEFVDAIKKQKATLPQKSANKESIFDILKAIDKIVEDGAKVETDEEMESAVAMLDIRELDKANKLHRIVKYAKAQQDMIDSIDNRIKELTARKKRYATKVEHMNKLGEFLLNRLGEDKIETIDGDIKWQQGKGKVLFTGQVPVEYMKSVVSGVTLDELTKIIKDAVFEEDIETDLRQKGFVKDTPMKDKIKKDIKNGEEISFAYIDKTKKGVIK